MQIGTITLTRPRVYFHTGEDAFVEPGDFPVFHEDGEVYWTMPARRSVGGPQARNVGGGMIVVTVKPDVPSGDTFTMESARMSRADFDAMNRNDETSGALVFTAAS
jgi:hypothetical protein